jgi:hypothetical protein
MRRCILATTTMVVLMMLFSTGCGLRAMTDPTYLARMDVRHRAPPAPPLKRNPNPTAYEITLTLHDPPGPFAHAEGFMQYETKLADPCGPDLGGISGTRMGLHESIPFEVKQVEPGVFRGIVYTDLIESHDYFGLGICDVPMIAARIVMWPTGNPDDTRFVESLLTREIISGTVLRSGFLHSDYPNGGFEDFAAMRYREGTPLRARVKESDLFNVELRAVKLE